MREPLDIVIVPVPVIDEAASVSVLPELRETSPSFRTFFAVAAEFIVT